MKTHVTETDADQIATNLQTLSDDVAPIDKMQASGLSREPHAVDPQRWADGTYRLGAAGNLRTGVRRYQLRGVLPDDVREHVDAFREGLVADRGGAEEMTTVCTGYVRRLAQLEGAAELLAADIAERGCMTERGRPRASYAAFLKTIETWDRLAQRLGMERQAKQISFADRVRAEAAKNRRELGDDEKEINTAG